MKKTYRDAHTEIVNFDAQDWILTSGEEACGADCPGGYCSIVTTGFIYGDQETFCSWIFCLTVVGDCDWNGKYNGCPEARR